MGRRRRIGAPSAAFAGDAEGTMQRKLRVGRSPAWLTGLISLAILAVAGLFPAAAQDANAVGTPAATAGGGGQYYIEFRSRYAWDYGHTFLVHGRVGEPLTKASVAGLSPAGDDSTAWVIGHYVPVPAATGWADRGPHDK